MTVRQEDIDRVVRIQFMMNPEQYKAADHKADRQKMVDFVSKKFKFHTFSQRSSETLLIWTMEAIKKYEINL